MGSEADTKSSRLSLMTFVLPSRLSSSSQPPTLSPSSLSFVISLHPPILPSPSAHLLPFPPPLSFLLSSSSPVSSPPLSLPTRWHSPPTPRGCTRLCHDHCLGSWWDQKGCSAGDQRWHGVGSIVLSCPVLFCPVLCYGVMIVRLNIYRISFKGVCVLQDKVSRKNG